MEVKVLNDGLLTNLEVLELIKERRKIRSQLDAEDTVQIEAQHREHIERKMISYIESNKAGRVSLEVMRGCLAKIKRLGCHLSEAEMVQLANLLPESDVELYLVVENVEERLSSEQQEGLKEIIRQTVSSVEAQATDVQTM